MNSVSFYFNLFMLSSNSGFFMYYMGGCCVASLSPSQGSTSWGAARRRGPTGGRAKGIPRYCFTLLSVPFTVTYSPLILPFFSWTTRSMLPAEDTSVYLVCLRFLQGYSQCVLHVTFTARHSPRYTTTSLFLVPQRLSLN